MDSRETSVRGPDGCRSPLWLTEKNLRLALSEKLYLGKAHEGNQPHGRGGVVVSLGTVDPLTRVQFPVPAPHLSIRQNLLKEHAAMRAFRVALLDGLAARRALELHRFLGLFFVGCWANLRLGHGRGVTPRAVEIDCGSLVDLLGERPELCAAGLAFPLHRRGQLAAEWAFELDLFEGRTAARTAPLCPSDSLAACDASKHENWHGFLAHDTKMQLRLFKSFRANYGKRKPADARLLVS